MARRATLTKESLTALGIEKLAKLVLDEAARNAPFKKLVSAALAGAKGPDAVAAIIDRRLASLARARGVIDWEKRKAFAADLRATLTTIMDELGPADPTAAVERLVRFLVCADGVFERVDDSSGHIQDIFHMAAEAVPGRAASMPEAERVRLVERLIPPLEGDDYGLIESVMHDAIPLLAADQLSKIDGQLEAAVKNTSPLKGETGRNWERRSRLDRLIRARQAIADQSGDVDRFIELGLTRPMGSQINVDVAERLLRASRAPEALDWVRRTERRGAFDTDRDEPSVPATITDLLDRRRVHLEVRILNALGEKAAAQGLRWETFEASLDPEELREYIKHLPDFEDVAELERAFVFAKSHRHKYRSLDFFLAWPRLDLAAHLVVEHRESWAGQHYGSLVPAAAALEHDYPVAATVLYRTLLDDILARARSPAYGHGARYLAKLDAMEADGLTVLGMIDHEAYRASLRKAHGRKAGFWSIVEARC